MREEVGPNGERLGVECRKKHLDRVPKRGQSVGIGGIKNRVSITKEPNEQKKNAQDRFFNTRNSQAQRPTNGPPLERVDPAFCLVHRTLSQGC